MCALFSAVAVDIRLATITTHDREYFILSIIIPFRGKNSLLASLLALYGEKLILAKINSYSNEFFQVTKLTMAARIHGIHEKR